MSSTRTTREVEEREYEGWDMSLYTEEVEALDIPLGVQRDGFAYKWVRMTVRGVEDYNLDKAEKQGWRPVEINRRLGQINTSPLARNRDAADFITNKDVVLCERPIPLQVRAKDAFIKKNEDIIRPLSETYRDRGNKGLQPTHMMSRGF